MKLFIIIFTIIFYGVMCKFRMKIITHRMVVKYHNKAIVDPLTLTNTHYNRTYRRPLFYMCYKVPIGDESKVNIAIYSVKNNIPLDIGVNFDMGFCKLLAANTFGARKMLAGSNIASCPIKQGCFNGTIDMGNIDIPPGFRTGNYLLKYVFSLNKTVQIYVAEWWGEMKLVNE